MEFNLWVLFVAALIPMIVGAIWYNPKVFGTTWLTSSGLTEEEASSGNMAVIFGVSYLFSLFIAWTLVAMTVHQFGMAQTMMADPSFNVEGSELHTEFMGLMERYGDNFRTLKHGFLHGAYAAITFALPIIGIIALFERRGWKYILVHTGYWIVSMTLMAGLIAVYF